MHPPLYSRTKIQLVSPKKTKPVPSSRNHYKENYLEVQYIIIPSAKFFSGNFFANERKHP
jgi:hypothetical protein